MLESHLEQTSVCFLSLSLKKIFFRVHFNFLEFTLALWFRFQQMFLFAFELMISKSPGHRQFNGFVEFFIIKPVNAGGPVLFTECWYYLTIPQ